MLKVGARSNFDLAGSNRSFVKTLIIATLVFAFVIPTTATAAERTYAACSGVDEVELLYKHRSCFFGYGAAIKTPTSSTCAGRDGQPSGRAVREG